MMKKKNLALMLSVAMATIALSGCGGSGKAKLLDPKKPVTVTVWNYYNGDQLTAFEKLVDDFNNTIGAEKGIVVESASQGSVNDLADRLLDSVSGKAGADDVPSMAAVYAETAYILDSEEAIVPMDSYFTDEELSEYVPAFIDEGRLKEGGELKMFPVSKSTEATVCNITDWKPFEDACGISVDSIKSYEDLAAAAKAYYEWSDSQTPDVPEDGKALYGRDSISNYIFVGTKQLGHEMFKVDSEGKVAIDMDRDTFKTLWDNYYIPFINGYYGAFGSYRSEDIKTGSVLAMTGSTSGVSYIPTQVTKADDTSYDIDIEIHPSLNFASAKEAVAVQQGAGYCIMKTTEAEEFAAAEFLKWFTDTDQNLNFSITSGYSPVKTAANDVAKIEASFTVDSPKSQNMLDALLVSAEAYTTGNTYTCKAFAGSKEVRDVLKDALENVSVKDREAVMASLAAGTSHEDAVKEFSTDEYFDAWFKDLCSQVEATVSK